MQRMRRFARFWDLIGNSGNFIATAPLLWGNDASPFHAFLAFSDWLYAQIERTHTIALETLARHLWIYLMEHASRDRAQVAAALAADWHRTGRKDLPPWLSEHQSAESPAALARRNSLPRQSRHATAH
jgi:hypothetical protein